MDFTVAEDFLDHLEMHSNGSFVLVKRDLPQPTSPSPEPIESEKPSTSPSLPEMLRNQIKVYSNIMKLWWNVNTIVF